MGALGTLWKVVRTALVIAGLLAVAYVALSYGWNGEPPDLSLE